MYHGKYEMKTHPEQYQRKKIQVLEMEEIEKNGVITTQIKVKTKEIKTDQNIRVWDFQILNLRATGADKQLQPTQLQKSYTQVQNEAAQANRVMEQLKLQQQQQNIQDND